MQPNFPNKSHLIRLTEVQKKKARRRLIGSIFLLLIALAVLLHVTANVQPIQVDPEVIEVKNTASGASHEAVNINDLNAVKKVEASTPAIAESTTIVTSNESAPSSGFKAGVVRDNNTTLSSNTESKPVSSSPLAVLKPRITNDVIKSKPSPEDILNGDIDTPTSTRYYVQLIGLADRNALVQLKSALSEKGFTTSIQTVDTPTGKVYRLRMGPFNSKEDANDKLDEVKQEM